MNFHQKPFLNLQNGINVGGVDHVPSTMCPRPARVSAHTPAYAESPGRAGMKRLQAGGLVGWSIEKSLVLNMELKS